MRNNAPVASAARSRGIFEVMEQDRDLAACRAGAGGASGQSGRHAGLRTRGRPASFRRLEEILLQERVRSLSRDVRAALRQEPQTAVPCGAGRPLAWHVRLLWPMARGPTGQPEPGEGCRCGDCRAWAAGTGQAPFAIGSAWKRPLSRPWCVKPRGPYHDSPQPFDAPSAAPCGLESNRFNWTGS